MVQRLALIFLVTLGHSCPIWAINRFIKKCSQKRLTFYVVRRKLCQKLGAINKIK